MSQVVGVYSRESSADAARDLLTQAGYHDGRVVFLRPGPADGSTPPTHLRLRGESMLRGAVRWGIIGALITEVPMIVLLFFLPVDVNVKVLLASTVWKFGGAFGAWIGAIAASERGLEPDEAARYQVLLEHGNWVLSAGVRRRHRASTRGAMLESDALYVLDVRGTFEAKPPARVRAGGHASA